MKEEKKNDLKQLIYLFSTFIGIFLFLFFVGWVTEKEFERPPSIQHRTSCLKYVADGTLYGGQPYCIQGPVTYGIAHALEEVPLNLDISLKLFYFVSLIITFYFLYRIKVAETEDKSFTFIAFIFLLLYLKIFDFASNVAIFFLLPGFYYLFYTRRIFLSSFLFACALFAKANTLFIIGPSILCYLWAVYKNNKRKQENTSRYFYIKKFVIILLPSLILFFFFSIIYDHFVSYYYLVHQVHERIDSYALWSFLSFEYGYNGIFLLLYIGIFVSIIRIVGNKEIDIFSTIVGILLPMYFIKVATTYGMIFVGSRLHYFAVFAPFYLITLYKLKKEIVRFTFNIRLLFFLGLIALTIPLYQGLGGLSIADITDGSVFNDEKIINKIRQELAYPLFTINTTERILTSKDYTKMFGGENPFLYLENNKFLNINPYRIDPFEEQRPDWTYAGTLIDMGLVKNPGNYAFETTLNKTEVEELMTSTISVIIVWPTKDALNEFLSENSQFLNNYCSGFVPFLQDPYFPIEENYLLMYFLSPEDCFTFGKEMITYYHTNFRRLCHRTEDIAKVIIEVMQSNDIEMKEECKSYTKTAVFLTGTQIQEIYFAFFIFMFLIGIGYKSVQADSRVK